MSILRALSIGLLLDASLACAGKDTPTIDDEFKDSVRLGYVSGSRPLPGSGGSANSGGSAGSAQANAGSGGDDEPAGGSSGSGSGGTEAEGGAGGSAGTEAVGGTSGSGSTTGCDGFPILQQNCGFSGCHAPETSFTAFAESATAAEGFAGEDSAICGGQTIFDPGDPGGSLVIQKMRGTQSGCGGPMPPAGDPVSDEDIDCVEAWIGTL